MSKYNAEYAKYTQRIAIYSFIRLMKLFRGGIEYKCLHLVANSCQISRIENKKKVCRLSSNTVLQFVGLMPIFGYSICFHAYNQSVFWDLFFDRCGYKPKTIDRNLFKRKKTRKIAYGMPSEFSLVSRLLDFSSG